MLKPIARKTDPTSSHEAAAVHTKSGKRQTHMEKVLDLVERYPGHTCRELVNKQRTKQKLDYHEFMRRLGDLTGKHIRQGSKRECKVSGSTVITWWPV